MDIHLVRDVLSLSTMVEVKDDWVRMNGWQQFVLPDATTSDVDRSDQEHAETYARPYDREYALDSARPVGDTDGEVEGGYADGETDEDNDEDDDEDVVFVMHHDAEGSGPWSPGIRP